MENTEVWITQKIGKVYSLEIFRLHQITLIYFSDMKIEFGSYWFIYSGNSGLENQQMLGTRRTD